MTNHWKPNKARSLKINPSLLNPDVPRPVKGEVVIKFDIDEFLRQRGPFRPTLQDQLKKQSKT